MGSITRKYHFEAGHFLPNVPEGHKCKRLHGHNYVMEVTVSGPPDSYSGFVIDFWDLDKIVQPIIEQVDHRLLNDIAGLENPTAEYIAGWFYRQIRAYESRVTGVRIYETDSCWADCP